MTHRIKSYIIIPSYVGRGNKKMVRALIYMIPVAVFVYLIFFIVKFVRLIKEDNKKAVIQKAAIKESKVYQKYSKVFLADVLLAGIVILLFTISSFLLFLVPAMGYKIELLGSKVSEWEPSFLQMILDIWKNTDIVKAHSSSEFVLSLSGETVLIRCLMFTILIVYLCCCAYLIQGWVWIIRRTYCMFARRDDYTLKSYRDLKYANEAKRGLTYYTIPFLIFLAPLEFVFYAIFRALFYHAEKDELLESLGIHMTMNAGMIIAIIFAVLCIIAGIIWVVLLKKLKKKIMQEKIECKTTETTETST